MNTPKPRVRLYVAGQAFYRLVSPEKGWRGPYGQTWCGAKWACVACRKIISGSSNTCRKAAHSARKAIA